MILVVRKLLILLWINVAHCSVSGKSYVDPIIKSSVKNKFAPGEDPCNPLYWYPRNMPDFCKFTKTVRPAVDPLRLAYPIMIPMPPLPAPIPPPPVPILPPPVPILPIPPPAIMARPPQLPLFLPASMISISSNPYSYPQINPISAFNSLSSPNALPYYPSIMRSPTGFVPGLHSLVTRDGGINIMPFSDVYADMLEKHKNKMIRRKLHKILDKYENDPYSRDYKRLRKYDKYF